MKENGKKNKITGIVLGGIGVVVAGVSILAYNSTGNVSLYAVPESTETIVIRTFNSQFTPYEGGNQSARQVRALRSAVEASNKNDEHKHKVKLDMSGVTLTSSGKYKITITAYTDGYVSEIRVEEE